MHPESQMMTYGHAPLLAKGAVKSPLYLSSTYVFPSAEVGKAAFQQAYGLTEEPQAQGQLIYSRLDHPNLDLFEKRLCLWDGAEEAAAFASGMSAISTLLLTFLKPGDLLLHSSPLYGGTDHFIEHLLPQQGIHSMQIRPGERPDAVAKRLEASGLAHKLALVHLETPANPTNSLTDIAAFSELAASYGDPERKALLSVDNTFMGPVWQQPLQHGADLVVYSATKYIGGHSDLLAGAILGRETELQQLKGMRTFLGNAADPFTSWLLLRSLETLKVRMDRQAETAIVIARHLQSHPLVEQVYYLGLLPPGSEAQRIHEKQHQSPGAMIAFDIHGGEAEAFQFLNALQLVKLAVSLGGTESLAQHPFTMTHAGVDPEKCREMGITEKMVRISVGLENAEDLIHDVDQAFQSVLKRELIASHTLPLRPR